MPFTYPLPNGTLSLQTQDNVAPDNYLTVAARDNPNRAFLFLSKVLGKHLPTPPQVMANTHAQLALLLSPHTQADNAPVVFIGMAETATALARGVYEHWLSAHPETESLYLATTRYILPHHQRIEFSEQHSHAPAIGLHLPNDRALARRLLRTNTLVLIDDELSTGKTFINLIRALQAQGLKPQRVIMVSLTDFADKHNAEISAALQPLSVLRLSLCRGHWTYQPNRIPAISPDWQTQHPGRRIALPASPDAAARAGTARLLQFSDNIQNTCRGWLNGQQRLLVLGCGEFMYAPYRLAAEAAAYGLTVDFCATTRSPVQCWGPIHTRLSWPDPYGEGITNFLYNYCRAAYDVVWLVSELPGNAQLRDTARQLQARLLYLPTEKILEDHTVY